VTLNPKQTKAVVLLNQSARLHYLSPRYKTFYGQQGP